MTERIYVSVFIQQAVTVIVSYIKSATFNSLKLRQILSAFAEFLKLPFFNLVLLWYKSQAHIAHCLCKVYDSLSR